MFLQPRIQFGSSLGFSGFSWSGLKGHDQQTCRAFEPMHYNILLSTKDVDRIPWELLESQGEISRPPTFDSLSRYFEE